MELRVGPQNCEKNVKLRHQHGLTWLKAKGVQCQRALHSFRLRSLSTVIASPLKIGFQPTFDSAVLISLPLRDFGFSSPVIVIVKNYFGI